MKASDKVYKMLSFQYKPLEADILNKLAEIGRHDLIKRYKALSSAKKIYILDGMAAKYGL